MKGPERAVTCPTCKARPGSPCMRPSGHQVFGGGSHAPRIYRFHDQQRRAEGHIPAAGSSVRDRAREFVP